MDSAHFGDINFFDLIVTFAIKSDRWKESKKTVCSFNQDTKFRNSKTMSTRI